MADGFYLMKLNVPGKPKRGDLMQTAVGTAKERTWLIWFVKKANRGFRVLRVRWWEIDPTTRVLLWRSAERAGGQVVWYQEPQPKTRRSIQGIL